MTTTSQGALAEQQAADYLTRHGYCLLARNFRATGGEIDLVVSDKKTLVFVEVKQRASKAFGGPLAAVTKTKQQRVARAAAQFIKTHPHITYDAIRFDVICILAGQTTHLPNAFSPARTTL